jgi:hypothetical protein
MLALMIAIVAVCGGLATFGLLTLALRAAWRLRRLPRDFPRAIGRRTPRRK